MQIIILILIVNVIVIGLINIKYQATIDDELDRVENKLNIIEHNIEIAQMRKKFHKQTNKILRKSYERRKKK